MQRLNREDRTREFPQDATRFLDTGSAGSWCSYRRDAVSRFIVVKNARDSPIAISHRIFYISLVINLTLYHICWISYYNFISYTILHRIVSFILDLISITVCLFSGVRTCIWYRKIKLPVINSTHFFILEWGARKMSHRVSFWVFPDYSLINFYFPDYQYSNTSILVLQHF